MIAVIIQAREKSSRFPKKIFKKIIKNENSLSLIIKRLKKSKQIKKTIVAIPSLTKNFKSLKKKFRHIKLFVGNEKDVLSRYYYAAKKNKVSTIVRITSDCPLIDWAMLDKMIKNYKKIKVDFYSNCLNRSFPDGYDIEIFSFKALSLAFHKAKKKFDREHVTSYFKRSKAIKKKNYSNKINLYFIRLTLDTKKDLFFIKKIYNFFYPKIFFKFEDVMKLFSQRPNLFNQKW